MRARFVPVLLALWIAGCGGAEDPGTPAAWTAEADSALADGDRLAEDPAQLPDAVAAWRKAGSRYLKAFRLEEPIGERAAARALLAFRCGRAWSKAARFGTDEKFRGIWADRALFWFAHARRLRPEMRQSHFERAVLLDSDIPDVQDGVGARDAYQAYLDAFEDVGRVTSEHELARLKRASERVKALGPPR